MSIQDIKAALGAELVTMRYEDGGRIQVFDVDGVEYRFGSGDSTDFVVNAIKEGRKIDGRDA